MNAKAELTLKNFQFFVLKLSSGRPAAFDDRSPVVLFGHPQSLETNEINSRHLPGFHRQAGNFPQQAGY